tara:strand:+ start:56 stop:346 length:291 start_codon:yes stop_codon:yes gene_type:complete
MKGPMYDFFVAYIVILLLITFLSIKEIRNEIIHIFYVIYLFCINLITKVKNFILDCMHRNPNNTGLYIANPISDRNISHDQFELSSQSDMTGYVEL